MLRSELPASKLAGIQQPVFIKMKKYFKSIYEAMKKDFLGEKSKIVPKKYWSQFVCLGGASEVQYQIGQLIPNEKRKILVVGIFGGRDYFYLKTIGKDVYCLDLYIDKDFEKFGLNPSNWTRK
jgi:hypothetical protein